jgi:hypothetical protein
MIIMIMMMIILIVIIILILIIMVAYLRSSQMSTAIWKADWTRMLRHMGRLIRLAFRLYGRRVSRDFEGAWRRDRGRVDTLMSYASCHRHQRRRHHHHHHHYGQADQARVPLVRPAGQQRLRRRLVEGQRAARG